MYATCNNCLASAWQTLVCLLCDVRTYKQGDSNSEVILCFVLPHTVQVNPKPVINNVGVRRQIGLKIVETLSVYFTKNCKLWVHKLITCLITKCLGRFINLLGVKLSFTLERAASNEYPLQTFSLKNKKYPLVLTWFQAVCIEKIYQQELVTTEEY